MNLARADAPQRQPGRELGTVVGTEQAVAGLLVHPKLLGLPEVMVQPLPCGHGAPLEGQHAAGIGHLGLHPEVGQRRHGVALQSRWHGQGLRLRQRVPHLASLLHLSPEAGKDVRQLLQLERQVVRMVHRQLFLQPQVEHLRHLRLAVELLARVLRRGEDRPRPVLLGEGLQHLSRLSLTDEQGPAHVFEVGLQVGQRLQQEPCPERAGLDVPPAILSPLGRVEDEHRDDLRRGLHRRIEGGVVGDPQVVSEPNQAAHGQRVSRLARTASPRSSRASCFSAGILSQVR